MDHNGPAPRWFCPSPDPLTTPKAPKVLYSTTRIPAAPEYRKGEPASTTLTRLASVHIYIRRWLDANPLTLRTPLLPAPNSARPSPLLQFSVGTSVCSQHRTPSGSCTTGSGTLQFFLPTIAFAGSALSFSALQSPFFAPPPIVGQPCVKHPCDNFSFHPLPALSCVPFSGHLMTVQTVVYPCHVSSEHLPFHHSPSFRSRVSANPSRHVACWLNPHSALQVTMVRLDAKAKGKWVSIRIVSHLCTRRGCVLEEDRPAAKCSRNSCAQPGIPTRPIDLWYARVLATGLRLGVRRRGGKAFAKRGRGRPLGDAARREARRCLKPPTENAVTNE